MSKLSKRREPAWQNLRPIDQAPVEIRIANKLSLDLVYIRANGTTEQIMRATALANKAANMNRNTFEVV